MNTFSDQDHSYAFTIVPGFIYSSELINRFGKEMTDIGEYQLYKIVVPLPGTYCIQGNAIAALTSAGRLITHLDFNGTDPDFKLTQSEAVKALRAAGYTEADRSFYVPFYNAV